MKVKIYGHGWVGKAMTRLFPNSIVVDPKYSHYESSKDKEADVAFICVPTPLKSEKYGLDMGPLIDLIYTVHEPLVVIRSTTMPGTCDDLRALRPHLVYQPEYLGESTGHPFSDMATRGFMVLGGEPEDRRKVIELYQTVYNSNIKIRQMSLLEAEIVKLSENRAILWKVAQHQELFNICERAGVDYYEITQAVYGDDPRFNLWFSFVYPDKRGANSKCIPKDIYGFAAWAESVGCEAVATKAILAYNETLIQDQVRA